MKSLLEHKPESPSIGDETWAAGTTLAPVSSSLLNEASPMLPSDEMMLLLSSYMVLRSARMQYESYASSIG